MRALAGVPPPGGLIELRNGPGLERGGPDRLKQDALKSVPSSNRSWVGRRGPPSKQSPIRDRCVSASRAVRVTTAGLVLRAVPAVAPEERRGGIQGEGWIGPLGP